MCIRKNEETFQSKVQCVLIKWRKSDELASSNKYDSYSLINLHYDLSNLQFNRSDSLMQYPDICMQLQYWNIIECRLFFWKPDITVYEFKTINTHNTVLQLQFTPKVT